MHDRAPVTSNRGLLAMIGLCTTILVMAVLFLAGAVFAPMAFALFIIALVWPVQKKLQSRLPTLVALAISILATVVIVTMFLSMVVWGFGRVGRYLVADAPRFQILYSQVTDWLEGHGIVLAGIWAQHFNVGWLIRLFQSITTRINSTMSFLDRRADLRDPRSA